jgi:hypothetical protein
MATRPDDFTKEGSRFMQSDSGFQDSVDKSREALRRSIADGHDAGSVQHWPSEPRSYGDQRERLQPSELHPFFRGLLETLPEPGIEWPTAHREQWLETARNIFALLYQDPGEVREPTPLRAHQPTTPYPTERYVA